jgi:hypothetical protein
MSTGQTTLTWAKTAALNPRTPICASCGSVRSIDAHRPSPRCEGCLSRTTRPAQLTQPDEDQDAFLPSISAGHSLPLPENA